MSKEKRPFIQEIIRYGNIVFQLDVYQGSCTIKKYAKNSKGELVFINDYFYIRTKKKQEKP